MNTNKQNYNTFFNKNNQPIEKPNTPIEEAKELTPIVNEGAENINIDAPIVETENSEGLDINEKPIIDETVKENDGDNAPVQEETVPEETVPEVKSVQKVKVTIPKLNIRKESNRESEIVTEVKKDDLLELTESTSIDGFYKVKTASGQNGYCMVDFVELV